MARNKFLKRMAVTALAASMTFGAVPAMATPALADTTPVSTEATTGTERATVTLASAADHLSKSDDVKNALNSIKTVTSATGADAIKEAVEKASAFSGYNVQVDNVTATASSYYDDGQHTDYHNYGTITGSVTLSPVQDPSKDPDPSYSQDTTTYNFVLKENAYTADEMIAVAEHYIQKYFTETKPFAATDETVEGKDGDEIKDATMVSMAQKALEHYGISEYKPDGFIKVVSAANTTAPVNDDKNKTMTFTSDITVSVDKTSHTKTYTATRDRAHSYLTEQFATAVKAYLEDDKTKFANDIDAEKLAGVINNLRFAIGNGKGVGSTTDPTYFDNFNGQAFAVALGKAGVKDYAQLKHIAISADNIEIGEANKVLAKHGVDGRVSVNFKLNEDGNNDTQVFTATLKLTESADERLTEMTDEMTRLFNAGDVNSEIKKIQYEKDNASAPVYVKAYSRYENGKAKLDKNGNPIEDKPNDTLGNVTADAFAQKLFTDAGKKQVNDAYHGNALSTDGVEYISNSATYSDYVEPTTKADGSIKVNATVRVKNSWYATYDGTMTPDQEYVTKDVTFTVVLPKLKTVPATDIELANARTIYIVRGYNGKLDNTKTDPTIVDLKTGVSGASKNLMFYVKPDNANDIVWTSSDPSVATVDENGIVTALKGGKTVITASSETNPKISDSITINVKETYNGFVDVTDPSAYYFDPVYWAKDAGVTAGTTTTTFSPSSTVSRGDMITWLYRYAGSPAVSTTTKFKDVKDSDYYAKAVAWATSKGITFGTSDTTFSPKKAVTRAEMISFLYRYSQAVGKTDDESGKSDFNDVLSSKYYASAVAWGAENGVVAGYADGTFRPDKTCTRAEGVSFIYRAVNHTKGDREDNLLQK